MSKATSLFLDFLRASAALTVLACHCNGFWYPDTLILKWWGHDAVTVFFILSGYVISHVTFTKETTPRSYIVARLSRLYSVVLPALILTALLQLLGGALFPAYYQMYARSHEIMHYLFTGLFLQSIWWLYANPGSNNPFWSLGYEFWYYVVFGILIFCQSREAKVALLFVVGLITGLKIWLLAPIWFFGVAVYVLSRKIYLSRPLAGAGLLLSVMAVAVSIYYLPYYPEPETTKAPLYCSGVFVRDCIIGLFLAAAIWFFEQAFSLCPINPWIEKPIRWIASHTFSLYLYHFPLLVFLTATGMFDPQNAGSVFLELILILGFILLLSAFTESKRHVWRQAFDHVWLKIEGSILNQFKA